jgi:bifunctional non-homologous end joining protein LigD
MGVTPVKSNEHYLYYKEGSSDKVYHCWMETVGANNSVVFEYGRRGSTLQKGKKIEDTHHAKAEAVLFKLVSEKLGKGYKTYDPSAKMPVMKPGAVTGAPAPSTMNPLLGVPIQSLPSGKRLGQMHRLPMLLNVLTIDKIDSYLDKASWMLQEKFDGVRMMLEFDGVDKTVAWNKKGQAIEPPEEFCSVLQSCFSGYSFLIDGEACGARYFAFDILNLEDNSYRALPAEERLEMLGMLMRSSKKQPIIMQAYTAFTKEDKHRLFEEAKRSGKEGVVIKDAKAGYTPGRPASGGPAYKCKFTASATCIVTEITKGKRSVQVAMRAPGEGGDKRKFYIVGNCTIPVNHEIPKVGELVEVNYLYAYRGGSLYQPVYKGPRPDQTEPDAVESLQFKGEERKTCPRCQGKGEVPPFKSGTPEDSFDYCPTCGGTGTVA